MSVLVCAQAPKVQVTPCRGARNPTTERVRPRPAALQLPRPDCFAPVGAIRTLPIMSAQLLGYARCSTDEQNLTAQRDRLHELGVAEELIYLDHGLAGTTLARPGLDQALAAVREGDTLIVTKLDRLARSVPDARTIGDELAARGVTLALGGQVYESTDPMGKMFYSILAIFAEFEVDLLRARTKEGMAVARAKGNCVGVHRSSRPSNSANSYACTAPASTLSLTSPKSSPSPEPRSTAPWTETSPQPKPDDHREHRTSSTLHFSPTNNLLYSAPQDSFRSTGPTRAGRHTGGAVGLLAVVTVS